MKYNLVLEGPDGSREIVSYDQSTGEIVGENGPLSRRAEYVGEAFAVSPDSPSGKRGDTVKTLKIQLGLKCNYSCSYCLQTIHIPEGKDTNSRDATDFLNKLDTWLESTPERIEFWGGEPLVYYKKLKVLIPALRERFPEAVMLMITNGSLLNDEIVDFIHEYDLTVAVSHDGKGQGMRSDDPFDVPEALAACQRLVNERKGKFSFNGVVTGMNADLEEHVRFFKDKFGPDATVSFEGIVSYYNDATLQKVRLTDEELAKIADEIFYGIVGGYLIDSSYGSAAQRVAEAIVNPKNLSARPSKCGMDTNERIAVDLLGNIMTCQNTGPSGDHYVGSVYDIQNAKVTSSTHWSKRENCVKCPMLIACGGGCMYQHGSDFDESCRANYHQALGVFKAAVYMLTGKVVTKISAVQERPDNLIAIAQGG